SGICGRSETAVSGSTKVSPQSGQVRESPASWSENSSNREQFGQDQRIMTASSPQSIAPLRWVFSRSSLIQPQAVQPWPSPPYSNLPGLTSPSMIEQELPAV